MRNIRIQKLVLTALFFAIGLILPFITGQIPQIGQMLLPMHLPVFLCSLIVGWPYGLAIGFLLPLVRSLLFLMPPLYPTAVSMAFELAAYGFFAGFIYNKLLALNNKKINKTVALFIALIASMLIGRVVMGIVNLNLYGFKGDEYTFSFFLSQAFLTAFPGIVMQLVLIPAIMLSIKRTGIKTETTL